MHKVKWVMSMMGLIDKTWLRKNISKLDVTAAEAFETGKHRTKTERNRTE